MAAETPEDLNKPKEESPQDEESTSNAKWQRRKQAGSVSAEEFHISAPRQAHTYGLPSFLGSPRAVFSHVTAHAGNMLPS